MARTAFFFFPLLINDLDVPVGPIGVPHLLFQRLWWFVCVPSLNDEWKLFFTFTVGCICPKQTQLI